MGALLVTTQTISETSSILSFRPNNLKIAQSLLTMAAVMFVLLFGWSGLGCSEPPAAPDYFPPLKARLVSDGFDSSFVESLYSRSEVAFDQRGISAYFAHSEGKLNYDQFLTRSSIDKTFDYLKQHEQVLDRVEAKYGVDGEVICAIILVETRLGKVVGTRLVLNTLSTLAVLGDHDTRDRLWVTYLKGKTGGTKKQFDSWAARKSSWAYAELKAFLEYISSQGLDPYAIYGSYAGALGISQFIPSSVLGYAQDGNQDGKINLFDHEDAIESIANYLSKHGWKSSLPREDAVAVILRYNNSRYYANTILGVSDRLKERRKM
jgi:membrane-bound lytic murein transglycosylase B